jgi:hypothetical protein
VIQHIHAYDLVQWRVRYVSHNLTITPQSQFSSLYRVRIRLTDTSSISSIMFLCAIWMLLDCVPFRGREILLQLSVRLGERSRILCDWLPELPELPDMPGRNNRFPSFTTNCLINEHHIASQ